MVRFHKPDTTERMVPVAAVKTPLIYGLIAEASKRVGAIAKDKNIQFSGGGNAGVRTAVAVFDRVQPVIADLRIVVSHEILEHEMHTVQLRNKDGKSYDSIYALVKYRFHFWAEDGSSVSCDVIGEANDNSDKAFSKTMTIAKRRAFEMMLSIAYGDDDPDFKRDGMTSHPRRSYPSMPQGQPPSQQSGLPPRQAQTSGNGKPAGYPLIGSSLHVAKALGIDYQGFDRIVKGALGIPDNERAPKAMDIQDPQNQASVLGAVLSFGLKAMNKMNAANRWFAGNGYGELRGFVVEAKNNKSVTTETFASLMQALASAPEDSATQQPQHQQAASVQQPVARAKEPVQAANKPSPVQEPTTMLTKHIKALNMSQESVAGVLRDMTIMQRIEEVTSTELQARVLGRIYGFICRKSGITDADLSFTFGNIGGTSPSHLGFAVFKLPEDEALGVSGALRELAVNKRKSAT